MPDRVALVDGDGTVLAANPRWIAAPLTRWLEPTRVGIGDHLPTRFRDVDDRVAPVGASAALAGVAQAVDDVLAGRLDEHCVELQTARGPGQFEQLRISAVGRAPRRALVIATDVSDLVLAEQRLAHESTHDPLTGLPNRTLLVERLEAALAAHGRALVAVVSLDLDRFTLVNATLGPQGADRVLVQVARRLVRQLEPGTLLARTGDDSFTVLLDGLTDTAQPELLAERLLAGFAEPFSIGEREVALSASAGVSVAAPGAARADDLLRDADVATRRAKDLGRGRMTVAHHAERSVTVQRLAIEQSLQRALERGELWLEFQPEVSLADQRVVGAEALLRWDHPDLGLLGPDAFVGIAEETGLIVRIGEWVLHTACREAARWGSVDELFVAVNVSAHQLADPGFPAHVDAALHEAGLAPARLCIEVTESAVVSSWDLARTTLGRLRHLGVQVAVDDFGSGYSSFSHLVRLPIDVVKIDASLVTRIAWDPVDRAVVESVVTLARRLGLRVVAEGVEDDAQMAVLRDLGCDAVQGFASGRPGDSAALLEVVRARR